MREPKQRVEVAKKGGVSGPPSPDELNSTRDRGIRLSQHGRHEEARMLFEELLSQMEGSDASSEDKAYVMAYLSTSYRILGITDKAEAMAEKAMELVKGAKVSPGVKAEVFYAHGTNFIRKTDRSLGMKHLERALSLFEMVHDKESQAKTCRSIGMGHVFDCNHSMAIVYFRKAHALFMDLGNAKDAAQSLGNLAVAKAEGGMFEEALEDMKRVLVHAQESKAVTLEAGTFLNIAMSYLLLDKPEESLEYCDMGLAIATTIKDMRMATSIIMVEAEALLMLGRLDDARSLIDKNFKMAVGIKMNDLQGTAFRVRGTMFRERRDLKRAEDDYSSAEKFFKEGEQYSLLAELYLDWAIAAHMAKDQGKARELADRARAIFKRTRVPLRQKRFEAILKRHGM